MGGGKDGGSNINLIFVDMNYLLVIDNTEHMVTTGPTIGTLNIYYGMGYRLSQATQVVEHDGLDLMSTK